MWISPGCTEERIVDKYSQSIGHLPIPFHYSPFPKLSFPMIYGWTVDTIRPTLDGALIVCVCWASLSLSPTHPPVRACVNESVLPSAPDGFGKFVADASKRHWPHVTWSMVVVVLLLMVTPGGTMTTTTIALVVVPANW